MALINLRTVLVLLCIPLIVIEAHPLVIKNSIDAKETYWSDPKAEVKAHRNSLFQFQERQQFAKARRQKRGNFDLVLGAEHEQNVGTDVSIEALVDLWKSEDANTRVSGSATYNQRFGADNINGNARFGGKITLHHTD